HKGSAGIRSIDRLLHSERGCLRGGKTTRKVVLHRAHPVEVVERIEAKAPRRTDRPQELVTPLPGPQKFRTDARAPAQLADPKKSGIVHALTIQHLDNYLTSAACNSYLSGGQNLYRRCTDEKGRRSCRRSLARRRAELGPRSRG